MGRIHLLSLLLVQVACTSQHPDTPAAIATLPGMPPVTDRSNIYSDAGKGAMSAAVRGMPDRIYVPNSGSNSVMVIDPQNMHVLDTFKVGRQPQHVTPSWDLKTLWVLSDLGDSLTRIDPKTGKAGETIPVKDPYNMYYTPDGRYAIVVAEREKRLDFRDASTMQVVEGVRVPCRGVDHMDFSADGRYLLASCEFSGELVKVDVASRKVTGVLKLPLDIGASSDRKKRMHHGGGYMPVESPRMPQDVRLSPDGSVFYVADMMADGVFLVDGERMATVSFIATGRGAHGIYPSRDAKVLYVSNRDEGSITLIDPRTRTVTGKWTVPGGGSPDMGGVSADGKVLWLSGRYHGEIYAIDTGDGHLVTRLPVGKGPHGLCVYPQPGRYSLGHTGNMR